MTPSTLNLGSSEASAIDVERRLEHDVIGWFTTVRPDGRPHAVPVWFLWHDGQILVMSERDTVKVDNLRTSPRTLLHLHTQDGGDGVVILTGTAVLSDRTSTEWLPEIRAPYTQKYADAMKAFGMGLDALAERFSVVIEFKPEHLSAW